MSNYLALLVVPLHRHHERPDEAGARGHRDGNRRQPPKLFAFVCVWVKAKFDGLAPRTWCRSLRLLPSIQNKQHTKKKKRTSGWPVASSVREPVNEMPSSADMSRKP